MKKITKFLIIAFLTSVSCDMNAQNGRDNCSSAIIITKGTILQTTIAQTNGGNRNDSAWFISAATAAGTINVNSCFGGEDTTLFIWNDCADDSAVAYNDDFCLTAPRGAYCASEIPEFEVLAGEEYFIQWNNR
ncbi:MAG: hypothetical protein ACJAX3_001399 [Patiriisocius sp.]|jgi:hypothetical protein